MTDRLSPRQRHYVEEYLRDLNASAAARRAGYAMPPIRHGAARAADALRERTRQDVLRVMAEAGPVPARMAEALRDLDELAVAAAVLLPPDHPALAGGPVPAGGDREGAQKMTSGDRPSRARMSRVAQTLAAVALAAGAAQDEAAAVAGVSARTIRRWLSRPAFVALVDRELEVYVEATRRAYVERYRRRLDAPPRRRPARPAAPAPGGALAWHG